MTCSRTETAKLEALRDRVKAATGPDRELGLDILISVGGWSVSDDFEIFDHTGKRWARALSPRIRPAVWDYLNPAISIDAALAFAERVLNEDDALELLAQVSVETSEDTVNGTIKGLPLAIIDATITTLLTPPK